MGSQDIRESRPPSLPSSRQMKGKWDRHTGDSRGSPLGSGDKAKKVDWRARPADLDFCGTLPDLYCVNTSWVSYLSIGSLPGRIDAFQEPSSLSLGSAFHSCMVETFYHCTQKHLLTTLRATALLT